MKRMKTRVRVLRKISDIPKVKGFKPYGKDLKKSDEAPINLLYEEYEAIRLSDYNLLNHHQASLMMCVSRPTFTRIYASALQKIAKAFIEGRPITIDGGKVYFDTDWFYCKECNCYFNHLEKENIHCPLCYNKEVDECEQIDIEKDMNQNTEFTPHRGNGRRHGRKHREQDS
jgi:predicted DNA-binding protein (UPF0251 family)